MTNVKESQQSSPEATTTTATECDAEVSMEPAALEIEEVRRSMEEECDMPMKLQSDCGQSHDIFKDKKDESKAPRLQSLPLDSLYCVASFLTPSDWCNKFGLLDRAANTQCREIVRRVRLHGFKCATEVITAWTIGQCEDAKELAALYINAGVPIYCRCLGHSYHSLRWRMHVEAKEISNMENLDPFYGTGRLQFRANQNTNSELTYLEEKSIFFAGRNSNRDRPTSLTLISLNREQSSATPRNTTFDSSSSSSSRKIMLPIHQHLLDQHRRGKYFVDDKDGKLIAPLVSLSADFFHPSFQNISPINNTPIKDSESEDEADLPPIQNANLESDRIEESDGTVPQPPNDVSDISDNPITPHPALAPAIERIVPEAYSASVHANAEDAQDVRQHLRVRFAVYQREVEDFVAKRDLLNLEECMLDMWDEFFPHTAGIRYYDTETAVPRRSCMYQFLTKPCPKEIGVVQCEIERVKVMARGKGVNVKGHVFPNYEYRLFIRDQQPTIGADTHTEVPYTRHDTLLMVAKNRGRKYMEASGTTTTKKGSNNYYLYLPDQKEVDYHYNINTDEAKSARSKPDGSMKEARLAMEDAGSVLLGRLQSNFFGTEFQIFTPRMHPLPGQKKEISAHCQALLSDDDLDYDSGVSSETGSHRRSRFGRLSLRRHNPSNENSVSSNNSIGGDHHHHNHSVINRAVSTPDILLSRQPRTNRRAIANDDSKPSTTPPTVMVEEEDGAITYTANILGSRPRIMDVCIPKVCTAGIPGGEWKSYLEMCEDRENTNMLGCLRQLLHRLDHPTDFGTDQDDHSTDSDAGKDYGLLALQNRPPWWNVELQSFVLNFGGRVSVASVKNFQLCERTDHDTIMLQFGRIGGRHSFTMDFQHPLTAVQAFSIAISSLQSKISFG